MGWRCYLRKVKVNFKTARKEEVPFYFSFSFLFFCPHGYFDSDCSNLLQAIGIKLGPDLWSSVREPLVPLNRYCSHREVKCFSFGLRIPNGLFYSLL